MKLRRLKWIALLLVALPVAVVVAAYATLASRDFEELRAIAEREVEAATGRELRVAGPIDIGFSLTPSIALQDVRFANRAGGSADDMARVERLELQVALLPLLSGAVEVRRFLLSGAELLLETDAEGRPNWEFREATQSAEQTGRQAERQLPLLEAVEIENARLVWRDGVGGDSLEFILRRATLRDDGQLLSLEAEGDYLDLPLALNGSVGTPARLFGPDDYPFDLAGRFAGTAFELAGTIADFAGTPQAELRFTLEGDDLPAFSRLAGRELPDIGPYALGGALRHDGSALSLADLELNLAEARLSGNGSLTGLPEGTPHLSLMLRGEGEALERLAAATGAATGAALPAIGSWQIDGQLEADAQRLSLSGFTATFGESDLAGDLSASLTGERPQLEARLTAGYLDLAPLLGDSEEDAGAQGRAEDDGPFVIPDRPLPFEALHRLDAALALTAERLRLGEDLEMEAVAIEANLSEGNLLVRPLSLRLYGGSLSGHLRINAARQPSVVRTELTIERINLGRLLRERGISEDLRGRLDGSIQLAGRGDSPRALASTLEGESEVDLVDGVISNRLLAILGSGLTEIMGPLLGSGDTTQLNCAVSRIGFESGVATQRAAAVDAQTFSLAGSGRVDLRDESLNLRFETASRVPALVSLAVPFNVTGTLKDPRFAPDPLGTAQRAAELAGIAVAPPAALAALLGADLSSAPAGENPCATALDSAAPAAAPQQQLEELGRGLQQQLEESLGGSGDDIGRQLRGLFGN